MLSFDCCKRLLEFLFLQKQRLKNISFMVFVEFSVAGIGVITQIRIANVLGIDNYGLIAYGMAIATYGAILFVLGWIKR